MTIDEAIEELQALYELRAPRGSRHEWEALQLGIEALKHIRYLQAMDAEFRGFQLPGETP